MAIVAIMEMIRFLCGRGIDYHVNERVNILQLKHMQIVVFDNQCIIEGAKLRYNCSY